MFFGNVERPPRLSEFDLEVPEKCIGQHPAKKRDECKLMILDKKKVVIYSIRNLKILLIYLTKGMC